MYAQLADGRPRGARRANSIECIRNPDIAITVLGESKGDLHQKLGLARDGCSYELNVTKPIKSVLSSVDWKVQIVRLGMR